MLAVGELELPVPGAGATARRWAALAGWGGRNLSLARLAEGHVDACAILAEAGRSPVPGALYGVWASRSAGAAVRVERRGAGRALRGTMRFCSGARVVDRALVVADPAPDAGPDGASRSGTRAAGERHLLEVDVTRVGVAPLPDTWCTAAMADADTFDVAFDAVPVADDADVGEPGWYVTRPGFALGGGGVAAVWWGGAAGIVDRAVDHLAGTPDRHALAHVGELHAALAATGALLREVAALADGAPGAPAGGPGRAGAGSGWARPGAPDGSGDVALAVATLRGAVERAVREVVDRVPRVLGPGPLSRDAGLAAALADLALYVRQHHAERDHAALGERVVDRWRAA